jgi:O-antigen/teichoic acid export membrane protein
VSRIQELVYRFVRKSFLVDSSSLFFANVVTTATGLLTSVILIRVLGADVMGFIVIAMTLINTVVSFMDVRTPEALIKFMGSALARERPREAMAYFHIGLGVDIAVTFVTVTLILLLLPIVVAFYPNNESIEPLARIYVWSVPFNMLLTSTAVLLTVFKRFRIHAFIGVVHATVSLLVLIALVPYGPVSVVLGYVANAVIGFAFWSAAGAWILVSQFQSPRGEGYGSAWRAFVPFMFHVSVMESMKAVAENIDVLLLGALSLPAEVTFYKIARNGASLMNLPISALNKVLYPLINEAWATQKLRVVNQYIRSYMTTTGFISLVTVLGWWFAGELAVQLVYGAENIAIAWIARILVLGMSLQAILGWIRFTTLAAGRASLVTFTGFAALMTRIVFAILLVVFYGAPGAAWAFNLSVMVSVTMNVTYVLPRIGIPLQGIFRPSMSDSL